MIRSLLSVAMSLALLSVSVSHGQATIGLNFQGSTLNQSGFIPPDTMAAVGKHEIVELINGRYAVYSKSDGSLLEASTLDEFWIDAGVTPVWFSFDPRILYDPAVDRWFACAADNAGGPNSFLVAVSLSSDPTEGWAGVSFDNDADDSHWADFPLMGMNADRLVITANMFPLASDPARTSVLVIPKADLLAGSIADVTLFEDLDAVTTGFSPQPIVDLDNGSSPLILLSAYDKDAGLLKTSSIGGPPGNPTLDTLGGFIDVTPRGSPPDIDQPGPKSDVDAGGNGFATNVVKIHVAGRTNPSLWAAHGVDIDGRAAIEWYEIDAVTNAVLQSGTISDPVMAYNYPSVAVNVIGDVVIGCSGGSPTQFMSTYAFIGVTTGSSTMFSGALLLREGNADYELIGSGSRNRWGDYSATMVDPYNPAAFWTIQEFAPSENVWSTQITQIIPDGVEPPERWLLDYPAADTFWLLRDGAFEMENGDCEWGPVWDFRPDFALVRGRITCEDGVLRYGWGLILNDTLTGSVFQLRYPFYVRVRGTNMSNAPAAPASALARSSASPGAALGELAVPLRLEQGAPPTRSGSSGAHSAGPSLTQPDDNPLSLPPEQSAQGSKKRAKGTKRPRRR